MSSPAAAIPNTQSYVLLSSNFPFDGVLGWPATGITVTNNSNNYLYEPRTGQFIAPGIQGQQISYTGFANTTNPQLQVKAPPGLNNPAFTGSVIVEATDDPNFQAQAGTAQSPAVTISGGTVIISGVVDATITNTPAVTLTGASNDVNISNTPSVNVNSGTVSVGNTPDINISSQSITVGVAQNDALVHQFTFSSASTLSYTTTVGQLLSSSQALDFLSDNSINQLWAVTVTGLTTGTQYVNAINLVDGYWKVPIFPTIDTQVTITVTAGAAGNMWVSQSPQGCAEVVAPIQVAGAAAVFGALPVQLADVAVIVKSNNGALAANTQTNLGLIGAVSKIRGYAATVTVAGLIQLSLGSASSNVVSLYYGYAPANTPIVVMFPSGRYYAVGSNTNVWGMMSAAGSMSYDLFVE